MANFKLELDEICILTCLIYFLTFSIRFKNQVSDFRILRASGFGTRHVTMTFLQNK